MLVVSAGSRANKARAPAVTAPQRAAHCDSPRSLTRPLNPYLARGPTEGGRGRTGGTETERNEKMEKYLPRWMCVVSKLEAN